MNREHAQRVVEHMANQALAIDPIEAVAQLMIKHGIATGHGDTLEELLREFDWQLDELRKRLHAALEALAKVEG